MDPYAYFDHFKYTEYRQGDKEFLARNLLTRVALFKNIKEDSLGLVDYAVQDGERADTIAYGYYGDDRLAWLVYLVNDIIDPYHDWPLSTKDFEKFVVAKYGSLAQAQEIIKHWRINWPEDESTITAAQYQNLAGAIKHYWQGVYGYNNEVSFYERKRLDDIKNTNRLVRVPIDNTANYNFQIGTIVRDYQTRTSVFGEITYVGTDHLILKNVTGAFSSGQLFDSTNNVETQVTYTAQTLLIDNIGSATQYWIPVSLYDYEYENNEKKKNIKLLERSMLNLVTDNLRDLLQQ